MGKNKTLNDPVFGNLKHSVADLWEREIKVTIFGIERFLKLSVDIDENEGLEVQQIRAFEQFQQHQDQFLRDAENEIFKYYQSVYDEYRSKYEIVDLDDKYVPQISSMERLADLVTPVGLIFPYARKKPTFGLLCTCTWEKEHGVAVKYEEGKITEVGFQDIVL